jgi:hypothetical protein
MVVMTVGSTLLVLAMGWIHQSFRLASLIRDRERHHQSLMRLSRQFRDDAHVATLAIVNEQEVTFEIEETTILYHVDGHTVARFERENGEDAIASQDFFRLDSNADVQWDASQLPRWISLNVQRGPGLHRSTQTMDHAEDAVCDLSVRAGVGRHLGQPIEVRKGDE